MSETEIAPAVKTIGDWHKIEPYLTVTALTSVDPKPHETIPKPDMFRSKNISAKVPPATGPEDGWRDTICTVSEYLNPPLSL